MFSLSLSVYNIYIYIYIYISKFGGCKRQVSPAKRNPVQTGSFQGDERGKVLAKSWKPRSLRVTVDDRSVSVAPPPRLSLIAQTSLCAVFAARSIAPCVARSIAPCVARSHRKIYMKNITIYATNTTTTTTATTTTTTTTDSHRTRRPSNPTKTTSKHPIAPRAAYRYVYIYIYIEYVNMISLSL